MHKPFQGILPKNQLIADLGITLLDHNTWLMLHKDYLYFEHSEGVGKFVESFSAKEPKGRDTFAPLIHYFAPIITSGLHPSKLRLHPTNLVYGD